MNKYGWIVAVERAPHLDAGQDKLFTVNLVRPWCDEEDPNDPRGPKKPGASDMTGALWLPWKWGRTIEWAVFGRFEDAGKQVWKPIDVATVKPPGESVLLAASRDIADAIDEEVKAATKNTQFPLSQLLEDLQTKGTRSHVHTLAPLTHWPARLSGGVLRLTWLMTCPSDAVDKCKVVVCFPKFEMKPGTVVTGTQQEPDVGTLNDFASFSGKQGVKVDYVDKNVSFLTLAADPSVAAGQLPQNGLLLSQGSVSRSALLAFFVNNLLPLPVLRGWIEKAPAAGTLAAPDVQSALARALWAALGFGREYDTGAAGRPNIVEFLVDKDLIANTIVLRNAIERGIGTISDAAAMASFRSAVEKLAAAPLSTAWTLEQQSAWKQLHETLNSLGHAALPAEEFRTKWAQVEAVLASEDGMRAAMGPWLEKILDGLFVRPEEVVAWTPVKEMLARVGEFRRDLLLRAQPFMGSPAQWEAARKVAQKPDDAATKELVKATIEAAAAVLGQAVQLPANELETAVNEKVEQFLKEMGRATDADRPRPRDRGLKLDFSGWDASSGSGSDHQLRGYAIGLCSGYIASGSNKWVPDENRAQWLTDTAVRVNQAWVKNDGGAIVWMHEAVGATSANGEKLVSVEYEGAPVATALAADGHMEYDGEDPDGFKAIDFAWNDTDRPLPLLGYGLYYAAQATPLDNVGAVIDKDLRGANVTELKEANKVLAAQHDRTLQYLSSETPGAPDCVALAAALYELSDETQAHAWQLREIAKAVDTAAADPAVRVPTLGKVALLAAAETAKVGTTDVVLFPEAKHECEFKVTAHGTHSAFIERWLATDRLLVEKSEEPSDRGLGSDAALIAAFARSFREQPGPRTKPTPAYHPAVSAIGVELVVPGKAPEREDVPILRARLADGKLVAAKDEVTVNVVATFSAEPTLSVNKNNKSVKLELPRGTFACLRFYSLVDEKHFKPGSSEQRYAAGLQNTIGVTFNGYRAFSPTELWFETIPAWPADGLPASKVELLLSPPKEKEEGLLSPNLLIASLKFDKAPKWAQWLKGAYLQRHEWHWTGYPVDFPSVGKGLADWVPSLAGVESFREFVDVQFTTSFAGPEWRIGLDASGQAVVHRWSLAAGARPARYVAYLARPMLRFRRWLNSKLGEHGPLAVEKDIYANGSLVPGRMREGPLERLPTPALRHSIPLTATYSPDKELKRGQNGVMLVFDDAIRRTDDLAQVGGLGDTIEIDLVETRFAGTSEIGNNPIFHGATPRPSDSELSADRAFGLTFDIGPNPKVTQTAIVVRPVNSCGNWVMAMARARRFILPETELATMLRADEKKVKTLKHLAVIPTRHDGKDVVPLDFVVDLDAPLQKSLLLFSGTSLGEKLTIEVPTAPQIDAKYRYLVTWHKARWKDGGDPTWRCQVMLQTRDDARLTWDTQPGTVRCFQNSEAELKAGLFIDRWYLDAEPEAKKPEVRRIRISDYTDPRWLTFIGSFGNEIPGMAHDYLFVMRDGKLDKLELAPNRKAALPKLRNRDASLMNADPTFHLALVFRTVPDAVQLRTEEGTGELVASYFVDSNEKPVFLPRAANDTEPTSLAGCYAHILTLQRINSLTDEETDKLKANSLPGLLECAFPPQGETATESILRLLPEYLGPVPIRN